MATAPLLIKHLQQTYDAVHAVRPAMQNKLDCLIDSQPYYKLQEDADTEHTYTYLIAETVDVEAKFSSLVAALKDWNIGSVTVEEALGLLRTNQKPASPTTAALCAMPTVATSVDDCADLIRDLFKLIAVFRSRASPAAIKSDIQKRMGFADTSRHLEVPLLNIAKQYNAAFKEVKALAKTLMDVQKDKTTIRKQLQYKQSMVALLATGKAPTTDSTIELLLGL